MWLSSDAVIFLRYSDCLHLVDVLRSTAQSASVLDLYTDVNVAWNFLCYCSINQPDFCKELCWMELWLSQDKDLLKYFWHILMFFNSTSVFSCII